MILTLTVNPAIDRNLSVDRLAFDDRAYILDSVESAGGRGINASCVIDSFGGKTAAILPVGGETGERLKKLLACCRFPTETVPVKAATRTNLNITDRNGLTIKLNEKGSPLEGEEVARIEQVVLQWLPKAKWLMLCGSLPPGTPADFYARLIQTAGQMGVETLLDTDGQALEAGLEAGPSIVTPNQQEAERLLDRALLTRTQFLEAAERIRMMGARTVVLSLGSRGAVGASNGHIVEAIPPRIEVVSPIGSGDALAASFVWALDRGCGFADAVRWGVAAGTASAMLPGVMMAPLKQTQTIYEQVLIREHRR